MTKSDEMSTPDGEGSPTTDSDHPSTPDGDRPPTTVPTAASPEVCPYCGLELPEERQFRLHLGLEHYGRLTETEREEFRAAYRAEADALDRFRIIALGGLVLLYFGFLLVYALLAA